MPPQVVDQSPSSVATGGTAPSAPRTFPSLARAGVTIELLVGLSIGAAVILTGVGIATRMSAAVVVGVVIGVAAAFVLASRGVGEGKAH